MAGSWTDLDLFTGGRTFHVDHSLHEPEVAERPFSDPQEVGKCRRVRDDLDAIFSEQGLSVSRCVIHVPNRQPWGRPAQAATGIVCACGNGAESAGTGSGPDDPGVPPSAGHENVRIRVPQGARRSGSASPPATPGARALGRCGRAALSSPRSAPRWPACWLPGRHLPKRRRPRVLAAASRRPTAQKRLRRPARPPRWLSNPRRRAPSRGRRACRCRRSLSS